MSGLVLDLELVPKTSWWDNARNNLGGQWDTVRSYVYRDANYECEIEACDGPDDGPPHAHEIWEYDKDRELQILRDVVSRCPRCHEVHHFGYARIQNNGNRAKERFMEFNDLDVQEANNIIQKRFQEWKRRSEIEWELDLAFLDSYMGITVPHKYIKRGPKADE